MMMTAVFNEATLWRLLFLKVQKWARNHVSLVAMREVIDEGGRGKKRPVTCRSKVRKSRYKLFSPSRSIRSILSNSMLKSNILQPLRSMASLVAKENCPAVEAESKTLWTKSSITAVPLAKEKYVLRFQKMSENATAPTYGSSQAAGADLYSSQDCTVPAKGKFCVSTDIRVAIPEGCYGRVAPRSGLAAKHFIDVGAGVIDSDYRGELKILLFNFGEQDFQVKRGDRIAQLICERFERCHLVEEEQLDLTCRGAGGFGSTGA